MIKTRLLVVLVGLLVASTYANTQTIKNVLVPSSNVITYSSANTEFYRLLTANNDLTLTNSQIASRAGLNANLLACSDVNVD